MRRTAIKRFICAVGILLTAFSMNAYAVDWVQVHNSIFYPSVSAFFSAYSADCYSTSVAQGSPTDAPAAHVTYQLYNPVSAGPPPSNCAPSGTQIGADYYYTYTCDSGYQYNGVQAAYNGTSTGAQCVPQTGPTCPYPAGQQFWTTAVNIDAQAAGTNICALNCNTSVQAYFNINPNGGSPVSHNVLVSTGAACPTSTVNTVSQGEKCYSTQDISPTTGKQVTITSCASTFSSGTLSDGAVINNIPDSVAISTIQTAGCTVLASGAAFCVSNAPNQPDKGITGLTQTPDAQVGLNPSTSTNVGSCSGNCNFNYYGQPSVAASTNYGTGGTQAGICPAGDTKNANGTCSSNGLCPAGQTKNAAGNCAGSGSAGSCGGEGQPECNVKVDETGTPTTAPDFSQNYGDYNAAAASVSNAANQDNLGTWVTDTITSLGLPQYSACQTITVTVNIPFTQGAQTMTLPTPDVCNVFEKLKLFEGWLLYAITALAISSMAARETK